MKIAAILFILSVCYIASTEQAAAPAGVHPYSSWEWKEMHREPEPQPQRDMVKMNDYGMAYPDAEAQFTIPTNREELQQCANQECRKCETHNINNINNIIVTQVLLIRFQ